jgi:hypothetical protein
LNLEKIKVERELQRLTARESDNGFGLALSDSRVLAAQRRADKLSAELARVTSLKAERTTSWQIASQVLRVVEQWLRDGKPRGTTLEAVETEPKLLKGETITDAITRLRKAVAELQAGLHRIRSAPLPASHAKRKARQQVAQLAERGGANVSALLVEQSDGKLQFQREMLRVQMHNIPKAPAAIGYGEVIDPVALAAWLDPQALLKKLDAEIDSKSDDKAALTPEARQQREAEVMADLLAAETEEAALVFQAQSRNLPVEHRADISPLAILGMQLVTAPRALPSPASDPMHAFDLVGRS